LTETKQDSLVEIEKMFDHHPFRDEKLAMKNHFLSFTKLERGIPFAFAIIYLSALALFCLHKP
jgi:hypothetical protein